MSATDWLVQQQFKKQRGNSTSASNTSTTKKTNSAGPATSWLMGQQFKGGGSQPSTGGNANTGGVNISPINSFLDDVRKYQERANARLSKMDYATAQSFYDINTTELENLRKRHDELDEYLKTSGSSLGIADYQGLLSGLEELRGMYDKYQSDYDAAKEHHAKWSPSALGISPGAFGSINEALNLKDTIAATGGTNEDWYAEMLRRSEDSKAAEAEALKAYEALKIKYPTGTRREQGYAKEPAELTKGRKAWEEARQNRAYLDYALKLAEQQRYDGIDAGEKGRQEAYAGQQAFKAWQAEKAKNPAKTEALDMAASAGMGTYSDSEAVVEILAADESYWQPADNWTVDEERQFYVLFNRDINEAKAYGERINNNHADEQRYAQQQKQDEWATKNAFTGAVATVGALAGGVTALVDVHTNALEYAARGTVTHKSYLTPADYSNVWTAAIASNLNEKDNSFNRALAKLEPVFGDVGVGDIYQTGYNVLQNLTYGNILGPGAAAVAYFGIGAKSGYEDAAARGASPAKAFLMGVTSGGIEYLTEKYSLDNLVSIKSPATLSSMIKSALVQGGIEMSEEELSMLGTTLADAWIMGDRSALSLAEEEYMLKGYSATDAKKMAVKDWWKDAAYTALSSAAAGSISGGIQAVGQNVTRYGGDSQELIDRAMLAPEGSETRMTAEKYQQALDRLNRPKGKATTNTETANAETTGTEANTDEAKAPKRRELSNAQAAYLQELTIDSEIKSRFKAAGIENEKAEKAVKKMVSGEEVSKSELKEIIGTDGALDIVENIQSDRQNNIKWNYPEREGAAAASKQPINKNAAVEVNGEQESIEAINYEGNKLQIRTASGWRPASSVSLPAEVQQLARAFSPYKDSAGAMFRMYRPGQDPVKFAEAWAAAENMYGANTNADISQARKAFNPADLTDDQLNIAFKKGRDRRNEARTKAAQQATQQAYAERSGGVSYDGGIVDGVKYKAVDRKKLTDAQKRQITVVDKLAKALKINFVLYESELVDGKYAGASGIYTANTVYLDVNAGLMNKGDKFVFGKTALLRTAAHELTHYIQANNLEGYNKLKDFLLTHISEYKGKDINDLVLQKQERAERANSPISADEAMDEIVADGCEMMLKDSGLISKLAKQDKSLAEQIKDWFANFSAEIEKAFAGIREEHEEARAMKEYAAELQQLWEDELINAAKGSSDSATTNNVQQADRSLEAETKYSIRRTRKMSLKEQLAEYHANKFKTSDSFYFGTTPSILTRSNLEPDPLAMPQDVYKKSTVIKHNIPRRVLKNLQKNLGKPVFSFSAGKQAAIAIDDIDGDGKPVVVAVHGGHFMDRKPVNRIASIYGLEADGQWLQDQIKTGGKFRVYDIEKANTLLQTYGYKAAVGEQGVDSWDRISPIDPPVKSQKSFDRYESSSALEAYRSELQQKKYSIANHPKYREARNALNMAETLPEKREARRKLKEVESELGYFAIVEELYEVEDKLREIHKEEQAKKERAAKAYRVQLFSAAEYNRLKNHFGATEDYDTAGYTLPDGTMLDFSGKHNGGGDSGSREVDHRDVAEAMHTGSASNVDAMIRMISNGSIRMTPETPGINLAKMPTTEQLNTLRGYINHFRGRITVDIDEIGGDTIETFSYPRGTSSSRIIADIKEYFESGKVPQQTSSVQQFRYQARDILPDERDLLMAEAAKRGASRELKRYRAKYREIERLRARLTDLEEQQRADGEDLSEEMAKTEAAAERAENKLKELEASVPIQNAMESALAEWRSNNDTAAARLLRRLNEENERLRERVAYYKEEMQLSEDGRQKADASDIRAMAADYIKEYGSRVDRKYLEEKLQSLANYIVSNNNGEGIDSHELTREARKIAASLVNNLYIRESSNEDAYNELRDYLKSVPLKISDELRGEAPEGIRRLRNQYYGRIRLENEGMAIDSAYMELQQTFGEGLFPNDITAHLDQIEHISEVLDELAPREVNPLTKTERIELGNVLANNIIDELLSDRVRQRQTLADRRLARAVSRAQSLNEELERVKREEASKRKELVQAKVTELRNNSIERDKAYKTTQRIKKKIDRLYKALKENSGKNHVPQEFKESVAAFLGAIDTVNKYTKEKGRAEYAQRVRALDAIVAQMQIDRGKESGNVDVSIPEVLKGQLGEYLDFFENAANSKELGAVRLSAMNSEELKIIENILSLVNKAIEEDTDKRLATEKGRISELADKDIKRLAELGKKGLNSKTEDFFNFANLTPVYYFKRLGEGATEIFHQLQKGFAQFAFHAQKIIEFAEQTYDGKFAKDAEETTVELELYRRLPDADPENPEALRSEEKEKVTITKAQLMSLYALSLRDAALTHLLGAGIRIGDIKQGGRTLEQPAKYLLSLDELNGIVQKHLSERQRNVAEKLVHFMSTTGSEWGNEVSMKRYGIKMFEEEHYFPMKTDETSRDVRNPDAESGNLFRMANQGFTKALKPNAKNALVLDSVFDVFANHMVDMAKYNTLALPAIDAMRYYNYKAKTGENESGQVTSKELRTAVEEAFGSGATKYFELFMKDLNGNREGGRGEDAFSKLTSHFKVSAVSANMRVWMLQYTSIFRASAVLNPRIIAQNSGLTGQAFKQAKEEMQKFSGDAQWKKLGFRDNALNANVRELIKQDQTTLDKIGELGMKPAELADERVWVILWASCKQDVREKTGLTGDALIAATEERFQEVIYKTQVTDSTLTKSQLMRSKGNQYTQMITSFMSEPVLSYNMVLDSFHDFMDESRRTNWQQAWQSKKGVVYRTLVTYVATSAAGTIVGAIANALRDDDEYESFAEKFLEAFKDNFVDDLNPLTKIPIIRDILNMFKGYEVERSDMASIAQAYKALRIWNETIRLELGLQEEATDVTYNGRMTPWGKVFETLEAVSQLTGLPISNLTRDVTSIWNSLVGIRTGMTIKTYDGGKESDIKWAYKDGYLSAEEAAAELLAEGIEDTAEDARWTVLGWDSGAGKYDAMKAALLAKDSEAYTTAVEELISKGASKSGIEKNTKSIVKEAYQNKEKGERLISKQDAIDLLINLGGMRKKDAEKLVQEWTSYVVDGIQYDDISEAYIAGDISYSDAVDMRSTYGGYTKAEAEETVLQWQCKKDTGIAFSEIKDEFIDGGISEEQAVAMKVKYGGASEEDAAKTVLQWQCEKDTGVPYEHIQQFYDASEISAAEVVSMYMTYGNMTEADALAKAAKFEFVDGNYDMNDISVSAVSKYNKFAKPTGVSNVSFYEYWKAINALDSDRDADGEIITNAQVKRWAYINSLNISKAQKDAMHLCFYSEKSLSRAPWN